MASHTKPPIPCYLRDGKAIGAHQGFARTFNWLVDWVSNFRVGRGLEFEQRPDSAHPRIQLEDGAESGGKVALTGTDGSSAQAAAFIFASAEYSNVTVHVEEGVVTVGVYYV